MARRKAVGHTLLDVVREFAYTNVLHTMKTTEPTTKYKERADLPGKNTSLVEF